MSGEFLLASFPYENFGVALTWILSKFYVVTLSNESCACTCPDYRFGKRKSARNTSTYTS